MPQLVTISEEQRNIDRANKDASFLKIVSEVTGGHIVSAVYLTGDGFDGEWMKESLSFLCKGRRVFMGKNLYSKGACYAAARKCMTEDVYKRQMYLLSKNGKVEQSRIIIFSRIARSKRSCEVRSSFKMRRCV